MPALLGMAGNMSGVKLNRHYKLLVTASAASNLADGVASLAFPWLATLITRDPFAIGLVAAAGRLPWLVLSLPAGIVTDRADRRQLIMRADCLRMALALGVVCLALSLPEQMSARASFSLTLMLAGFAFLLGCAEVFRDNAAQTLLPSLVEEGDLEKANGYLWSAETVMGLFIGPPLAGYLIYLSAPAPFTLMLLCFGTAALLVRLMAVPRRVTPQHSPWREELSVGLSWLWRRPVLRRLALSLGVINGLSTMAVVVLVLYSQEVLGLTAAGYGWLLTVGAAGGTLGGIICPRIRAKLGAQRSLLVSLALMPVPFLLIAFTSSSLLVAIALFLQAVIGVLWNVVTVSYRQRMIPDDLLGRVNSAYRFFGWGSMSGGALLGGAIVVWAEPSLGRELALRLPFALAALGTGILVLWGAGKLRI